MLIISGHKGNANQNHTKIPLTPFVRIAIIKNTTTTGFGKDVGKRNTHTLLVGMQASTATLKKTKHRSAI
jgi:hypothetical protein